VIVSWNDQYIKKFALFLEKLKHIIFNSLPEFSIHIGGTYLYISIHIQYIYYTTSIHTQYILMIRLYKANGSNEC